MLTKYGRALSKEILSTWGYEGEENWHYGALNEEKIPAWLNIGGDYRAVQVHSKDERATVGRFIEMQEQAEVAAQWGQSWLSITAGSDTLKGSKPWYLPSFYFSTNITEKLQAKVGRFVPRFGINTPEHILSTRGPIGFGIQSERDSAEFTYIEEKWDASVSASVNKLRNKQDADGFYGQANYSFTTHDRVGFSVEKKVTDLAAFAFGLHGLVGLTKKLYLTTDSVWRETELGAGGKQKGLYHFAELGYELEKGLHIIALEDIRKTDLDSNHKTISMYGAGINFFPRPHFELRGIWAKRKDLAQSSREGDYAWLLMHFYL